MSSNVVYFNYCMTLEPDKSQQGTLQIFLQGILQIILQEILQIFLQGILQIFIQSISSILPIFIQ
ncbi:hypothetical protein MAR_018092, partial [Mya arenaria]